MQEVATSQGMRGNTSQEAGNARKWILPESPREGRALLTPSFWSIRTSDPQHCAIMNKCVALCYSCAGTRGVPRELPTFRACDRAIGHYCPQGDLHSSRTDQPVPS